MGDHMGCCWVLTWASNTKHSREADKSLKRVKISDQQWRLIGCWIGESVSDSGDLEVKPYVF